MIVIPSPPFLKIIHYTLVSIAPRIVPGTQSMLDKYFLEWKKMSSRITSGARFLDLDLKYIKQNWLIG